MTTTVIFAAIIATGVYLRWATGPVLAAYQVGRQVERIRATLHGRAAGLHRVSHRDR